MTSDQRRTISYSCTRRTVSLVDNDKTRIRLSDCNDRITVGDFSSVIIVSGNRVVLLTGYTDDIDEVL